MRLDERRSPVGLSQVKRSRKFKPTLFYILLSKLEYTSSQRVSQSNRVSTSALYSTLLQPRIHSYRLRKNRYKRCRARSPAISSRNGRLVRRFGQPSDGVRPGGRQLGAVGAQLFFSSPSASGTRRIYRALRISQDHRTLYLAPNVTDLTTINQSEYQKTNKKNHVLQAFPAAHNYEQKSHKLSARLSHHNQSRAGMRAP